MQNLCWTILFVLLLSGCHNQAPLGTIDNPIKLYFTPSVDADSIASNSEEFIKYLENQTGLIFKTGIPKKYTELQCGITLRDGKLLVVLFLLS